MAYYGKAYTAFIMRTLDISMPYFKLKLDLYFNGSDPTIPDQVKRWYPWLYWENAVAVSNTQMIQAVPAKNVGNTFEQAMLLTDYYVRSVSDTFGPFRPVSAQTIWDDTNKIWAPPTAILAAKTFAAPDNLWAWFPYNGMLAKTTPAPFGFGNGLIQYQMLNWSTNNDQNLAPYFHYPFPGGTIPPFFKYNTAPDLYFADVTMVDVTYIFTPEGDPDPTPPPSSIVALDCWTPCGNLAVDHINGGS